jgi:hypothetical protein
VKGVVVGVVVGVFVGLLNIGLLYSDQYLEIKGNVVFTLFAVIVFGGLGYLIGHLLDDDKKVVSKKKKNDKHKDVVKSGSSIFP